jgi:hypothetical protein
MKAPVLVVLTRHAEAQAVRRGISPVAIAELVLTHHADRRHNPRSADWVIPARGIGTAYNWPDQGDPSTALVVTVWSG